MLYIASTNGMVKSIHYCMNEQLGTEFSLSEKEHKKCPRCGMEDSKSGCCSDEHSIVKLDTNHQGSDLNFEAPLFFLISLDLTYLVIDSLEASSPDARIVDEVDVSSVPIYVKHCSYLI